MLCLVGRCYAKQRTFHLVAWRGDKPDMSDKSLGVWHHRWPHFDNRQLDGDTGKHHRSWALRL